MKAEIEKIDVELLLSDFRVKNKDSLQVYLKELWKDLSQRSEDKSKGVNRVTFSKYYNLPGIILDRLFNVFDADKNEYLDCSEFCEGMTTLFCDGFDKLIKFIFKFYDFDNDKSITKEDIRVVLSYIPLNKSKVKNKLKFETHDYKDRIESQDELKDILDKSFENLTKMDFPTFSNVIENKYSEICLYILIYLLESKPFSDSTLAPYANFSKNKSPDKETDKDKVSPKLIASPSMNSKLSPGNIIKNSPSIAKKKLEVGNSKVLGHNNVLASLTGKSPISKIGGDSAKSKLEILKNQTTNTLDSKNPIRKHRENLKNLEELDGKKKSDNKEPNYEDMDDMKDIQSAKKYEGKNQIDSDNDDDDDKMEVLNEGYLFKITQTKKLKSLFFRLINKDLYCKI